MINWFLNLFDDRKNNYEQKLLAFAKREYPKDWEHAFYMLKQGKQPFLDH